MRLREGKPGAGTKEGKTKAGVIPPRAWKASFREGKRYAVCCVMKPFRGAGKMRSILRKKAVWEKVITQYSA